MKRPAFQFYPADWRKDVALQSCSMAAQGLWINMLCLAHECEPYGHLTINNRAMTPAQLGRQVGLSHKEAELLVVELDDAGVLDRTSDGTIYSRRMVRDERIRNVRADAGRLGGNPNLLKQKDNQEDNQTLNLDLTPSSSSSSSSSTSVKTPPTPKGVRFSEFWEAWPQTARKVAKAECEKRWKARGLDAEADAILAHVSTMKPTRSWQEGFEPAPLTYLNQRRWEDGGGEAPAGEQRLIV